MTTADTKILEDLCIKYGTDMVIEALNISPTARKKLLAGLAAGSLILGAKSNIQRPIERDPISYEQTITADPGKIDHYDELVQATKEYINWAVNCIGHDYSEVEIKPEKLVELCHKYKYDLPTLLATIHGESHFGVTPRAKKTGSPCSVGCWDDGQNRTYYDDQNDAIEDYIKIMKDHFIRNRSISDAFQDGELTNENGSRYASAQNYEQNIRSMRNRAIRKFPDLNYLNFYSI